MPIFWSKLGERPDFLSYVCVCVCLCVLFCYMFILLLCVFTTKIRGCPEHAAAWHRNTTARFSYSSWKLNPAPGKRETLSIAKGDIAKR